MQKRHIIHLPNNTLYRVLLGGVNLFLNIIVNQYIHEADIYNSFYNNY
jgi:hypothetical protein